MNQATFDYVPDEPEETPVEQVVEGDDCSNPTVKTHLEEQEETGTDLLVVEPDKGKIVKMFSEEDGLKPVIDEIKKKVEAEVFDVSTEKGRERMGSVARQIGSAKKFMEKTALELTEDWRSKTSAVNAEKKRMIEEMDTLRDKVLAPRKEYERIEAERVAGHEKALQDIEDLVSFEETPNSDILKQRIQKLSLFKNRDWQEFEARGIDAQERVKSRLETILEERVKYEEEQAELERLRKEKEERERQEREEALKKEIKEIKKFKYLLLV